MSAAFNRNARTTFGEHNISERNVSPYRAPVETEYNTLWLHAGGININIQFI